jgi:hypothetical protein
MPLVCPSVIPSVCNISVSTPYFSHSVKDFQFFTKLGSNVLSPETICAEGMSQPFKVKVTHAVTYELLCSYNARGNTFML